MWNLGIGKGVFHDVDDSCNDNDNSSNYYHYFELWSIKKEPKNCRF